MTIEGEREIGVGGGETINMGDKLRCAHRDRAHDAGQLLGDAMGDLRRALARMFRRGHRRHPRLAD